MSAPLNASANPAGVLFSSSRFEIPPFQREYSWERDEVEDFWRDLSTSKSGGEYFLGLIILTEGEERKIVVDGQQRLLTITLFATAIHHLAKKYGRSALADSIEADFLRLVDYETDKKINRIVLTDIKDNATFEYIVSNGVAPNLEDIEEGSVSKKISDSYKLIMQKLKADISDDPFRLLGRWAEFLTNKVYFAVFIHHNAADAYQVFEVINTRGKELTTADLLKNYIISQTPPDSREEIYHRWQILSRRFELYGGSGSFVQFIRHVVTTQVGHVLPKDLYNSLAGRRGFTGRHVIPAASLVSLLEENAEVYMQMVDPASAGPVGDDVVRIFSALNSLNVIALRPLLLALFHANASLEDFEYVLRFVVARIVVGNLGTGNVERLLGQAAYKVSSKRDPALMRTELVDLYPQPEDFGDRVFRRSFNKNTLLFVKNSILQNTITPNQAGVIQFVWPKLFDGWKGFSEEHGYWYSTLGNVVVTDIDRRPSDANDNWDGFKAAILPAIKFQEERDYYSRIEEWSPENIEKAGAHFSSRAVALWYK